MLHKIENRNSLLGFFIFLLVTITLLSSASLGLAQNTATVQDAVRIVQPDGVTDAANYIIQLSEESVASYRGNIRGLNATAPVSTGVRRLDVSHPDSVAYQNYLLGRQGVVETAVSQELGRAANVQNRFQHAFNGFVVELTPAEAARIARIPGIKKIFRETFEVPLTDSGPAWIGAPTIWDGSNSGLATKGEGIVVAVIDTGINSQHPSFATIAGDGYVHTNPLGSGNSIPGSHCDTNPGFCNDKLIGAWSYVTEDVTPEDSAGHGSHTASTLAGNEHTATMSAPTISFTDDISGVAPRANIIAYDVCSSSCSSTGILSALDQIIIDSSALPNGISVINFSLSGGANPYNDSIELGFLSATDAGIFVSASAGNNGPGASTVAHRGPWVATVGASSHDRGLSHALIGLTSNSASLSDISGAGLTSAYGPANIVYAGDFGDGQCLTPFAANTWVNGEIVLCDRGTIDRTEKGENVLAGGAGGFILANTSEEGSSIVNDGHFLPGIHVTFDDGVVLKDWIANNTNTIGSISGTILDYGNSDGDIMADFSSRGPNSTFDMIKPDIAAPGLNIWAAIRDGGTITSPDYGFDSGTSMASPHNAGSAALISAVHPDWSVQQIKSALMTTSIVSTLLKEDGITPADSFDYGAGRIDLTAAALAGLVLDETVANFENADPDLGGDPATLNVPSMQDSSCVANCSWTRTVESTLSTSVTWNVTAVDPTGTTISVTPSSFTIAAGASQILNITVDVTNSSNDEFVFGRIILTANGNEAPDAHLPVAVIASEAVAGTTLFTPIADALVSARRSNRNFGTSSVLRINDNPNEDAYLKFDIQGLGGASIINATLRLYVVDAGSQFNVFAVSDNSWEETTITFDNAPTIGSLLGNSGSISSGAYVEIDVTSHVTGDGWVSFAVEINGATTTSFDSREATNMPELLVDTGAAGPTATPTNTAVPPTPTNTSIPPTPTNTPAPTDTPTPGPTATNTPIPPTATNTPIPPTATNTPIPPTATNTAVPGNDMHVGDLDGTATRNFADRTWDATVTILVVDDNGALVENATVDGSWAAGNDATASCTTNSNGECDVTQIGLTRFDNTETFTVDNVTHASLSYNSALNSDPDGDSDGTSITLDRP